MGREDIGVNGLQKRLVDEAPMPIDSTAAFTLAVGDGEGERGARRRRSVQGLCIGIGVVACWSHDSGGKGGRYA